MRRTFVVIAVTAAAFALAACASSNQPAASEGGGSSESASAAPQAVPPPAGSPLAKINNGMPEGQVIELLGQPSSRRTYQTGKAWIPWYYGSDTHRTDLKYKGQGRVVLGHNRWSGAATVIRIDYDPAEAGY